MDPRKDKWIHSPVNEEQSSLMFYVQTFDELMLANDLRSFQELVDENSERILVFKAHSYRERQIWVEIIGSIIYLQLIAKIEQTNVSNTSKMAKINWNEYDFFTLLDRVDFERSKLLKKKETPLRKKEHNKKDPYALQKLEEEKEETKSKFKLEKK